MELFKEKQEYEILTHILQFLRKGHNNRLSQKLIQKFGSLKQVLDADTTELKGFVSDKEASFIAFIKECAPLYISLQVKEKPSVSNPQELTNFLKARLSGEIVEKLYLILLNSGNKVIDMLEIESGTVNKSVVIPRKIVSIALKLEASAVILAHNHPAGSLRPSDNDISATKTVKNALRLVDINLLDHIIIANNDYFSFKEYSLI